ncbi:aldo/keto reductase [Kribbella sp. NPDC023855]|uniref:aldo/keto reductase n=1 Tax=Kribbella sp. NPDC023855 TaxID=3154698 RepID=UPI0033E6BBC0
MTEMERSLGRSGRRTSALGIGTWAIGGPWTFDGRPTGWGAVDDDESIRMIHTALDEGVRLIDTADCYGAGHSERIIGQALRQLPARVRDDVVIATKFGHVFDEETRSGSGTDVSPEAIRRACAASLRRLGLERIDLYQLHGGVSTPEEAVAVVEVLEDLVSEGLVASIGTSSDAPEIQAVFATSQHACAVQTQINVFGRNDQALLAAEKHEFAALARSPLAMGLLTGKYDLANRPPADDVRRDTPWWTYFDDKEMPQWLARLDQVRTLLTDGGRTLAQGCLAYLWGLNPAIIPLPGARTSRQAMENARAMTFGPLAAEAVNQIDELLAGSPERHG